MATTPTPPAPPSDGPSRELLLSTPFLLKRLGMAVKERGSRRSRRPGMNPQHHAVLSLLDEGARETQGDIADALGYDRSQLVGLLDELEERGLVERRRDPVDRRRHLVSLTPAGKRGARASCARSRSASRRSSSPARRRRARTLHELLLELACHHNASYVARQPKR